MPHGLYTLPLFLPLSPGHSSLSSPRRRLHRPRGGVSDGDTLTVLSKGQPVRIRLHGIDCPEKRQAVGKRAKHFTSQVVYGKTVTVKDLGQDRYGRTVGEVMLPDGRNLNHEIVREGSAWWYRKYAPEDETLKQLEAEAGKRSAGCGSM